MIFIYSCTVITSIKILSYSHYSFVVKYILVHVHEVYKAGDYLSFNLVAFFSASLYGSNTNCKRPIFKQSNIPLYQSLRVFVNKQ